MATISLNKWKQFSKTERVDYLRKGKLKVEQKFGFKRGAKMPDDTASSMTSKFVATVRGILIGLGDSEYAAYRAAYSYLAEYNGDLPPGYEEE